MTYVGAKPLKLSLVALLAIAAIAARADAQSLRELRSQEAENAALAEEAGYTSSICQTPLRASIDWRTTANWPENVSLAASCDGALGALESICRTPDGRKRAKRITRFVCAGDGSGPSISGHTLRFGAEPGGNGFAATKSLLESQL